VAASLSIAPRTGTQRARAPGGEAWLSIEEDQVLSLSERDDRAWESMVHAKVAPLIKSSQRLDPEPARKHP
jgi:hypothetical protein